MKSFRVITTLSIVCLSLSGNLPLWGLPKFKPPKFGGKLRRVARFSDQSKTPPQFSYKPRKIKVGPQHRNTAPQKPAVLDILNDHTPTNRAKRRAYLYDVGTSHTPAKKHLNNHARYLNEIKRAGQLYDRIQHTPAFSPYFKELRHEVEETIVNKTLRASLLKHIEEGNQTAALNELTSFYHLAPNHIPTFYAFTEPAEMFARQALEYLQNHPHKPNWPLRYILKTEGIDPALKAEIRNIVNEGSVPADYVDYTLQLFQTVYEQYQYILEESLVDESVQGTVLIYKYLVDELEVFTSEHQRLPQWEFEEERDLFNLISVLAYSHRANRFEQVIPYIYKLYDLFEKYPVPHFDESQTMRELDKFIKEYKDLPQSIHIRDFLHPRGQENMLYESVEYWKRNSPSFRDHFNKVFLRQTIQTEHLPPPFNYY